MSKLEADWVPQLRIKQLLEGVRYIRRSVDNLSWSLGNKVIASAYIKVEVDRDVSSFIEIITKSFIDNKEVENTCIVKILKTKCNFGGHRYWFECPIFTCHKRVGILYLLNNRFACRYCYNLTYSSRNISGNYKTFGRIISQLELNELKNKIKRFNYAKKPTKKVIRFIKKYNKHIKTFEGHVRILESMVERRNRIPKKLIGI